MNNIVDTLNKKKEFLDKIDLQSKEEGTLDSKTLLAHADQYINKLIKKYKVSSVSDSDFLLLGALPATGKSSAIVYLNKQYKNKGNILKIDPDEIRSSHPQYNKLFKKEAAEYERLTRWYSLYIRYSLFELVILNQYNAYFENPFEDSDYVKSVVNYFQDNNKKVNIIAIVGQVYYLYASAIKRMAQTLRDKELVTRELDRAYQRYNASIHIFIDTIKILLEHTNVKMMDIYYRFYDHPRFSLIRTSNDMFYNNSDKKLYVNYITKDLFGKKGQKADINIILNKIKDIFTRRLETSEFSVCIEICDTCLKDFENIFKQEKWKQTKDNIVLFKEYLLNIMREKNINEDPVLPKGRLAI